MYSTKYKIAQGDDSSKFDNAYEKFISGPQLVKNNEVEIDGPFSDGPNYVKVNVDQNMVKAERFSREAIRDCFGVTMLQMLLKRLEKGSNGTLNGTFVILQAFFGRILS